MATKKKERAMRSRIAAAARLGILAVATFHAVAAPVRAEKLRRLDGTSVSNKEVDATVKRLIKTANVTGIALAVLNDDKLAYAKGFGYRNVEKKLPLNRNTVMYGASFTKSLFACLVMQLVDEGKLDLDKPVYEYLPKPLPEYEAYRDLAGDDRYKKITARMLLDHTSGFPNWRWFTDDRKLRIYFGPGTRFAYSGEGISLLQLVVETITRKSVAESMQDRILRPAGMTRTAMVWDSRFEDNFALGYDENGKDLGAQRRSSPQAAGSMVTTVADMGRFLVSLRTGMLLRKSAIDKMLSPQIAIHSLHEFPSLDTATTDANDAIKLSYGLGWGLFFTPVGKAYFKEGHDDGWNNHMVCFDETKICMVMMSNSSNGDSIFKELLQTVIGDTYTPWEWEGYVPYQQKQENTQPH
jgi:CubicO group peptidase (beta-lactamase class C family)